MSRVCVIIVLIFLQCMQLTVDNPDVLSTLCGGMPSARIGGWWNYGRRTPVVDCKITIVPVPDKCYNNPRKPPYRGGAPLYAPSKLNN